MEKQSTKGFFIGILVLIMTFMFSLSLMAPSPLTTNIVETSGWDYGQAGQLISLIPFLMSFFVFATNPITAKLGSKMGAVIALGVAAIGSILAFFAGDSFAAHMAARIIYGVGFGIFYAIPNVVFAEFITPKAQPTWISVKCSIDTVGSTFAFFFTLPFLAMLGSWQKVMGFFGILLAVVCVIYLIFGKSPNNKNEFVPQETTDNNTGSLQAMRDAVKNKTVWLVGIVTMGAMLSYYAFSSFLPTFLETFRGYSSQKASSITGVLPLVMIFVSIAAGAVASASGRRKILGAPGLIILIVGILLSIFTVPTGLIILGVVLIGVGISFVYVYFSVIPNDIGKSNTAFIAAALAIIVCLGHILTILIPPVFQAAINSGMSVQIAMMILAVPTIPALIISLLVKETGPITEKQ